MRYCPHFVLTKNLDRPKNILDAKISFFRNWQQHAAFQRSAFGRSTAGNDVVATIVIKGVFGSKAKVA